MVVFTTQELDLLFEAVEKWEQGDLAGEIMGSMIESMALGSGVSIEFRHKIVSENKRREEKRIADAKIRKERGVLLRAKLIQIRDSMDAESVIEGGGGGSKRSRLMAC